MIAAALDAGAPCARVLAGAVYVSDKRLRMMLERRDKPYVLAVHSNERIITDDQPLGLARGTAADLAQALPASRWAKHTAGADAKGAAPL